MSTGPTSAAAATSSLQNLRTFRRFEIKFVVPESVAARFRESLQPWMQPDAHSPAGGYGLESLYYDSPDLRFYWEKIDGTLFRRKIRVRRYVNPEVPVTDATPVWLEIKQRYDRVTQKRRVPLRLGDAVAFLDQRIRPTEAADPVLDEVEVLVQEAGLVPTIVTGYHRTAFVGTDHEPGLRVTFDHDLYERSTDLSMTTTGPEGPLLPPGWVVIEIKVNDRLPGWLSDLIAEHGLTVTRISKYVQAVERAALAPPSVFHHVPIASPQPTTESASQ